ncbi:HAMP domain-containing sensor histidine kinase [Actinomyces sp. F1_1611]
MGLLERTRRSWTQTPLAGRMVLLIIVIVTTALAVVGTIMIGILQRHLIRQVDEQLVASASQLANTVSNASFTGTPTEIPTNFYIRREVIGQQPKVILTEETRLRAGTPVVGELLDIGQVALTETGITLPITVSSDIPGANWRAVAVPMEVTATSQPAGVVTVALPLIDVSDTILNTTLSFFLAGLGIVVLGGIAGYYLVIQSLRPLREIETVAGKIAAGDYSQRIIPLAPATEVGSLSLSLNQMLAQIESSFAARDDSEQKVRRFVSDASHELRTPLAAIRGYGELYRMGAVPPERVPEVFGRIESESTRMGALVEDLLILARIDEKRPLSMTQIDLVRLAREARSDLEALNRSRTIKLVGLSQRKPPPSLLVSGDRDQLTQVMVNLVGNIDRYTPANSPVEIAVGQQDEMGVIEFRDHGPGISPEERSRVFERFYRTDTSRARSLGGSGLGLSIVGGIIEAHHGRVELADSKGGGLTVRVFLPLSGA